MSECVHVCVCVRVCVCVFVCVYARGAAMCVSEAEGIHICLQVSCSAPSKLPASDSVDRCSSPNVDHRICLPGLTLDYVHVILHCSETFMLTFIVSLRIFPSRF